MISNSRCGIDRNPADIVSIPNGDKHDFKLKTFRSDQVCVSVSIPNGDKHDFKLYGDTLAGIPIAVSIPNGDKHDFKP